MIKIICDTLEEVYAEASSRLECSINDIHIDMVQYPRNIFGIIKRKAIAIANKKEVSKPLANKTKPIIKEVQEPTLDIKPAVKETKKYNKETSLANNEDAPIINTRTYADKNNAIDNFYKEDEEGKEQEKETDKSKIIYDIKKTISDLFCLSCLECELSEVSFVDNKTIYIKFIGKDSALLIGKNGYRYKAISYLIFCYIFSKYNLFVKIEIDKFLYNQTQMIKKHLREFVKTVKQNGKGSTDFFDGVLLHIVVEYLREEFSDKMVIIKSDKNNNRFVRVSDFRK